MDFTQNQTLNNVKKRRTKKQFLHQLETKGTFPMTDQEVKWFERATRNIVITSTPPTFEEFEVYRNRRMVNKFNHNSLNIKQ